MPTWHGDGSGICRLEDRSRRRQPCSFLRRSGLCARRQVSPAPHFAQARARLLVILPSLLALTSQFALLSTFCLPPWFGTSQLFTFSFAIRNPGREIQASDRRRWGS